MALGEVDYGLMGLVGGMTAFISFFNSLMATAVGRFFAYSIGASEGRDVGGLEECRRWFNVSLLIHTVVPVCLLIVGYPIGEWAVRCFLTIPLDRVFDCVWVWRFVCFSCFLSMVTVPFNAMYVAKQYIAELTIYTFVTVTLNGIFLFYMVSHPGVWLVRLSLWSCLLGVLPQIIIATRAFWIFPECRVIPSYMWNMRKIKDVSVYAFYRFFGALGLLVSGQGFSLIVNKMLGPAKNAAMNIGYAVSGHSNSLAGAFLSALSPAITTAYGSGNMERVRKLVFAASKLTTVMVLIFALPLALETDEVFHLWLKTPPEGCVMICLGLLFVLVCENMCCGHYIAIFADGDIKWYQIWCLLMSICALPIAWFLMKLGHGIAAIAYALGIKQLSIVIVRLYFGRKVCGLSIRQWMMTVSFPIVLCSIAALAVGFFVRLNCDASFRRVMLTTVVVNATLLPFAWFLVLGESERELCRDKIFSKLFFFNR